MKLIHLYFILIFSLFSCQEKIKFNMPEYDDFMMTSNTFNLPFNVNFTPSTFPKNLKRFEQKKDREYVNILEYDKNKNLIFKYYRQYVDENWNGKFLTIIERNFYDDKNQLIKTIILHSNTGSHLNEYHYDTAGNLTSVNKTDIEANGSNNNPWRYIENLTKTDDFDQDKNVIKINKNKNVSPFIFKYDFENKEVKAYFDSKNENDNFYVIYKFNSQNQLISKTTFNGNTINYPNSYFINYKDNQKITTEYDDEKNITQKAREFQENKFTFIETTNTEYKFNQKRKYFGKTLISDDSFSEEQNEKTVEKYDLDDYNIPVKMTHETNGKVDSTVNFVNKYEFY
jgi:YD repeat-containing protein